MKRSRLVYYFMFTLGLLLAGPFANVADAKCSLAPLDAERREERIIAYVCIHGDLSDLKDVPNDAEWIEFTVARLNFIPADAFSRFTKLRRLTFYNCELREISEDAFAGLNDLELLVMSNTKLNVARASMFKHLANLKMLTLDSTGLSYIEPAVFKTLSKRLEVLNLRNNDLDCLPVEGLASMEKLKTIEINDNPWLCDCRQSLMAFFEKRKIEQGSLSNEFVHYRRKRWHTNWYNESYSSSVSSSSSRSSNRVFDCMAIVEYPPLPPTLPNSRTTSGKQFNYDYSHHQKIEWREATVTSISHLDRLPDEIGWIEIFDVHIPTIKRYLFFRFGNSLRSITLSNCKIEYIEREAFAGLHHLERLTIVGARLPVVANYWFRDLTRLTDLILEKDYIERFEYGVFDNLRHLKRLNLRANRLNCLPQENLDGISSLERLEAGENPWLCSCRRDLEQYLSRKRIGYEISNSRADGVGCIEDGASSAIAHPAYEYQNFYNLTSTGTIRWSWGYETHIHRPATRPPPTSRPPLIVETKPPPVVHQGGCRSVTAHAYHHHHRYNHLQGLTYICSRSSLTDLREIPSTVETIIFSNSVIHTLHSDYFRKFDGSLRRLEFRDCSIQSIDDRAFSGLRNLESLIIRENDIEVVRSEWFTEIRNLRHLDLSKNNIGRVDNGVFDLLPRLVSLDISDNLLNCIGIEHLEKLQHLRELNVIGNPWTCLCATRLARLIDDRSIYCAGSCLNSVLQGDGISSWGGCHSTGSHKTDMVITTKRPSTSPPTTSVPSYIPDPASYTNTSGTCSSSHEHTHYHCSGGDIFLTSNIPSNVRSIEIYDSYIPHLPAASFSRFHNLTELILRNVSLRDIDPRTFQGLHRLERLIIRNNRFTVVRNGWFRDCGNLYWLDLSKNNLVEIQTGAFDSLKQLQYLNLEDNAFQCVYTSCFVHLPRLDTLEFGRNPLKWRCWQDLRQFLEVRAIGYTYYKCPHDSRDLVRHLQNDKKPSGQTGGASTSIVGMHNTHIAIIVAAIIFLICDH